ncbi:hypothetical protein JS528_10800 [Bifidobacterium sp. MA2]|uniref:Uncharacterized protein n=1 Tax=Bifidobacterium santillanense TaxID=2809028 RepID=A0ABS5US63_9BIFI|nr:hypothetical protein [Bifidobacterium santillanense]MBT1173812.1 hypothetical protein [Bifidobacterium santillanense]
MSDDLTLDELLLGPAARQAARDVWHGRRGPEISAWTIGRGATGGFGEELARAVLDDPELISQVNGIWESRQAAIGAANETGLEALPEGFRRAIRREERDGGPRLNLDIAHAAGRGWTDADWDMDLFSLELEACPFDETMLAAVGTRGDDASREPGKPVEEWETQFHADHLTVYARRHDTRAGVIIVQIESTTRPRTYRVTLHWPDGTSTELPPATTGVAMAPTRFGMVAAPDGALPERISIALA